MDGSRKLAAAESRTQFERFSCWNAEHRVREEGFKLVEGRLAESRRHVADHAGDRAADAIVAVAEGSHHLCHARGSVCLGAASRSEALYLGPGDA